MSKCGDDVDAMFALSWGASFASGFVDNFLFYSLTWVSRRILLMEEEEIPNIPVNKIIATLACLFTCGCIAHML